MHSVRLVLLLLPLVVNFGLCGAMEDIDHQVHGWEAFENAKDISDASDAPSQAGCRSCSSSDIKYCRSRFVMDDHCCCDRRHKERFPFIPHVCYKYLLPQCKPIARDCDEYSRLYACCCRPRLSEHYEAHAWAGSSKCVHNIITTALILFILMFLTT